VARHSQSGVIEMQVLCAWCCRDGKPGYLGEREPLENPEPTHGVCAHHKAQLLESLPSRSFPDAEMLIVVHRNNTVLYEHLERSFAAVSRVKLIVDRRVCDRRAAPCPESNDRRHLRTRRVRKGTISPLGDFTVVRFAPKVPTTPASLELDQRAPTRGAFDSATKPVDLEHIARSVETAVMMERREGQSADGVKAPWDRPRALRKDARSK